MRKRPFGAHTTLTFGAVEDDEALVAKLQAGDEAAFAMLVRAHHASLARLATSIVGSRALADEVVQDTWLAVVRGVHAFEGRSSLRTWLFRILVNRARTTAGKERRVDTGFDVESDRFDATGVWSAPPVPWSEQVDDRLVAEQLAPMARTVIDMLPDLQRQVLLLRDVEGLPAADVADLLGVTDGNQRVLLHRARAKVRAELEAKLGKA
jgi:RNA polymerase sigma-70 factor (ECF subfamily)